MNEYEVDDNNESLSEVITEVNVSDTYNWLNLPFSNVENSG